MCVCERERETERERDRARERHRQRERERQTDRDVERDRELPIDNGRFSVSLLAMSLLRTTTPKTRRKKKILIK